MNIKFHRAFRRMAASATVLAALASSASAASLTYTLQGVTFNDGTAVTGSFTWDTSTARLTFADIVTRDGAMSAFEYTLDNSYVGYGPFGASVTKSFLLAPSAATRYISFVFDNELSSGGINPITISGFSSPGSYECTNCGFGRVIVSGSVAVVPEPATYAMLLGGLGVVAAARRRRKVC